MDKVDTKREYAGIHLRTQLAAAEQQRDTAIAALETAIGALECVPMDAFSGCRDSAGNEWPLRDELLDRLRGELDKARDNQPHNAAKGGEG